MGTKEKKKLRIGITQGDINGIGPEVVLKTLNDARITEFCTPILYSSPRIVGYFRKALGLTTLNTVTVNSAAEAQDEKVNVVSCISDDIHIDLGKATEMGGQAAVASLLAVVKDQKEALLDAIVTAPINKANVQSDKFRHVGHTEFFQAEFGNWPALMLMVSDKLRIGMLTTHVPLSGVSALVTKESILDTLRLLHRVMPEDFSINRPRIAVLSLNPHAGDGGLIGKEEQNVIIPAIEQARAEKMLVFGPYPTDGFFGADTFRKFDVILAMYHDQGMTAFKILSFDNGVNYTAGLPVVRTSPAHGTAYDLVGKDTASPEPFRQALYLACDIARNRVKHHHLVSNAMTDNDSSS